MWDRKAVEDLLKRNAFGVKIAAPTTRSAEMTISDHATCVDPYLASFEQSFAARNYKPATLENYRHHLRRFGRLLEAEGIAPSELTADVAVELGRRLSTSPKAQITVPNLARLFVQHLIEIGVATRPPRTAAQAERQELLGNLELYLLRQRGLSPRSVKHVRGFAPRFLVHRFGEDLLVSPTAGFSMNWMAIIGDRRHTVRSGRRLGAPKIGDRDRPPAHSPEDAGGGAGYLTPAPPILVTAMMAAKETRLASEHRVL
ncbi:hypothetical protein [Rhizobium leguminosarum]